MPFVEQDGKLVEVSEEEFRRKIAAENPWNAAAIMVPTLVCALAGAALSPKNRVVGAVMGAVVGVVLTGYLLMRGLSS